MIAEAREPDRGSIFAATSSDMCQWSTAQRVASHAITNASFYNPAIHAIVDNSTAGAWVVIFSGSLSDSYTTASTRVTDGFTVPR